jgi:prolyl-tRNA editing enzyme YbaK/EbsC (Cys-tRNA(Pro) deacylase)
VSILGFLRGSGVPFELVSLSRDVRTVEQAAAELGIPARRIAKALVTVGADGRPVIVTLPGDERLPPGERLVPRRQVEELIGLPPGAVTPLVRLVRRDLDVVLNDRLLTEPVINVSAGTLSLTVTIAPADLRKVIR